MATGSDLLSVGRRHVGEEYRNVIVPKDNARWRGPWDCAEFATWCVYQATGRLYGCVRDDANPSVADAYTGAWWDDAHRLGEIVTLEVGVGTVGAMLLRRPPSPGAMGHIAISDGKGGTVEARGRAYGVCGASAQGRGWEVAVLIPWIDYDRGETPHQSPEFVLRVGDPAGRDERVRKVQRRLVQAGLDPGPVDGVYGPKTASAVEAYQQRFGVTPDGEVGPITWSLLIG